MFHRAILKQFKSDLFFASRKTKSILISKKNYDSQSVIKFNPWFTSGKLNIVIIPATQKHPNISVIAKWLRPNDILLIPDWGPPFKTDKGYWLDFIGGKKDQCIFLTNCKSVHDDRMKRDGVQSVIINNNAWINEKLFYPDSDADKIFDACYTARAVKFKRIHLAKKVENLALVINRNIKPYSKRMDYSWLSMPYNYINISGLNPQELRALYTKSKCGLMLSDTEGACYTVTEYLLCGIPVISTKPERRHGYKLGGREFWLDDNNSIYSEPSPRSVSQCVSVLSKKNFNAQDIHQATLRKIHNERDKFVKYVLAPLFRNHGFTLNAADYFQSHLYGEKTTDPLTMKTEDKACTVAEVKAFFNGP